MRLLEALINGVAVAGTFVGLWYGFAALGLLDGNSIGTAVFMGAWASGGHVALAQWRSA